MTAKTKVELLNGKRGGYIKFCFFGEIKYFKFSQNTKEFSKKMKNFLRKKKNQFKQNFLVLLKLNFDRLLTSTTTKTDHDIT